MAQVILTNSILKNLENKKKEDRIKIYSKLASLEKKPLIGAPLCGIYKDFYCLHVWPFQLIYKLEKEKIFIIDIKKI